MDFRVADQLLLPWSPRRTISAARVADLLDVSKGTVLRLIEDGRLKAYRVRNSETSPWRINYDSVIAYLESVHADNCLEKRF